MPHSSRDRAPEAAGLILCLLVAGASGQGLDLGGPLEPPPLGEFTHPNRLIGELESEIAARLAEERDATPLRQVVVRATVNLRIIAADLLGHGDQAGREGGQAVVMGETLANGREQVEALLRELVVLGARIENLQGRVDPATSERFRQALRSLRQFNEDAVRLADSVHTVQEQKLDRHVPAILASLSEAVSALSGVAIVSHWPPASSVAPVLPAGAGAGSVPTASPTRSVEELSKQLSELSVRDDTRQELALIVDFLRRGERFADLRPRVLAYRRLLAQVLDLADSLARADWLDPATRDAYSGRLHLGVMLFKDPRTRDRGQRHLDRLESSRAMIDRVTALESGRQVDLESIKSAFLAADAMIDSAAEARLGRQQLEKLLGVVDRMIEYRELGEVRLRRELRSVYRSLDRLYQEAESALLEQLTPIAAEPDALADPAFSSLLADHRQYLEDLRRIRKVPAWLDALGLIQAKASPRFYAQVRKMGQWLLDPNRRPDAILALDQFEQQLALFYPLPFEGELRAGDPLAVQATGGQHEMYVRQIEEQRRLWAEAWGAGDAASPAANRMLLLYRLNQTMMDTASIFRLGGDATVLNRWAAWELGSGSITRAISELPNRLKLATASTIEGDDRGLVRQLERIDRDAPMAKLLGRLSQILSSPLAELPTGAPATLGQLMYPPTPSAWLFRRRTELTDLCRYALEEDYARSSGQMSLADELASYINQQAERLLEGLGERRDPLPTLIGFDGSDPRPGGQAGDER